MKTTAMAAAAAVLLAAGAAADDAAKRGAEPGKWTQDHEAAVALAKEKGLPLFLKFTGSDWCGWCMLMEEKVFSQKAFKSWAADHIVLCSLDFPRGKNVKTVPDAYRERNKRLASEYGVGGYPTYFVLSPGGAKLGRMGAQRDYTAEKFLDDLKNIIENGERQLLQTRLTPAERAEREELKAAPEKAAAEKAALEKAKADAIAEGKRKIAAAASSGKDAQKAVHDEVLASFRALEASQKEELAGIDARLAAAAERLAELEAKLK